MTEEATIQKLETEIRETVWGNNEKLGHARAFLLTACVAATNQATYYHYPAFYLVHHALEVLMKAVFLPGAHGHNLIDDLYKNLKTKDRKFFTTREVQLLKISDKMNKKHAMRYFEPPHGQFDWSVFVELLELGKKILAK